MRVWVLIIMKTVCQVVSLKNLKMNYLKQKISKVPLSNKNNVAVCFGFLNQNDNLNRQILTLFK